MKAIRITLVFITSIPVLMGCDNKEEVPSQGIVFEGAQKVTVTGYADHLMEPFLSRDGSILMFNNSNEAENTNLHWATRLNDSTFEYKGEIAGVNTENVEGVPSMDMNGILYFVSTRAYEQSLATIYKADFTNGTAANVVQVEGLSKNQIGWLNFDVEVNASGETIYFVDGRFDQSGGPHESDIAIAKKVNGVFQRLPNSDEILENVNTDALEYAACISADNLELYFTRVSTDSAMPDIFLARRSGEGEPFGTPSKIESITGFVEAATLSPDGTKLYYHKKDNGKFVLYLTNRVK